MKRRGLTIIGRCAVNQRVSVLYKSVPARLSETQHSELPWHDSERRLSSCFRTKATRRSPTRYVRGKLCQSGDPTNEFQYLPVTSLNGFVDP